MLTFVHAADFHLDSPFSSLTDLQAMERRREFRSLPLRLAEYVNKNHIDFVLLAGDLFDASSASRDTAEQLARALGSMNARVFCAPGNHDWYGPRSPWQTIGWPENVTVFRENTMTAVEIPEWNLTVYGAAFTGPEQTAGLLNGFTVPKDKRLHVGLLHGEVTARESTYNPIHKEEIAQSGLHYLALGHIHTRRAPERYGRTVCAWPGCMEGRGFDELGDKGFYRGTLDEDGTVSLSFV
ncbi:MAG: DNA repair exonuclease, partial [Oscillibacter sp.]|nr:DNA repair exonuclease [Oscillibacter sp.]